ncbi:unnamed protein product [Paramecium sonneborni]|uniref:Peptidase M14 domain-containing protein n=1 Tax=Paramecium sonneborni TaxID=65129 RepID=A0A8S1LPC8_9CILI|nr:unnamed protein product [Paramecium sonneborni]
MIDFNTDEHFYGINKSLYYKTEEQKNEIKKMDPEYLTRTGTDFVLLPNSPEFINHNEPFEPMYIPKQTILEESLRREIERICFADTLLNKVVFDCADPSPFTKDIDPATYGLEVLPYYLPQSKEDSTLVFESRFESGNLRRAIQICDYEYNLILKPDYYTTMNTQWFYFSLSNTRKDVEYRFNIINMMKPDSLYNSGMKPLMYSEQGAKQKKIGWFRDGHEICYYQNNMKRKNGGFYYTLTFAVKFQHDFDCVYIAHCYPYTYTHLCRYLKQLESDPAKKNRVKRKQLCQTIAGNMCDFLIIGDFNNGKEKKGIVITSRVHPGETMASYVMEYMIDFLTGNTHEARILRENFIFKIVPMLNIDGVVNGNYRCNLAGVDLNRQWIDPNKKQHPTIYHTKQLVKKTKEERDLVLFCDIHGHSRKKNIFMYGCSGKDPNRKELVFPMLNRNNCSVFSFKDCCFLLQKDREGSARIALWRELSIINCYTLEMSFCGADFGKYEYFHFNLDIYKEIAQSFCLSIIDCYEPEQIKVKQVLEEIEQNSLKNQQKDDKNNSGDEGSDYSNDDPKEQAMPQQQIQLQNNDQQLGSQTKKLKKIPLLPPKKKKGQ